MVDGTAETLAHHRPHRAAEELELEGTGHDRQAFERSGEHHQRILLTGVLLGSAQPVFVALAVAETQRIFGADAGADLGAGVGIEEPLQALPRTDPHVMAALRADMQVALELGAVERRVAGGALDPQAFRDRARTPLGLDA